MSSGSVLSISLTFGLTDGQIAKYQAAFLNRQFINIMCANGIPERLFVDLFQRTVSKIKGLAGRVENGTQSQEDIQLISICSEVLSANSISRKLTSSSRWQK